MSLRSLLGFRPSPHDHRDWPLERLGVDPRASIPLEVSYEGLVDEVFEQSGPSCVGEATARAWHLRARIQGEPAPCYPDALAVYALARAAEFIDASRPLEDSGAFPRCALQAVSECGVVARGTWQDPTRLRRPDWAALRASADRRVVRYARLWTAQDARSALAAGHPVLVGIDCDESFLDYSGGVWAGMTGPAVGGHAVAAVGYRAGAIRIVNSWSTGWGEAGFGWLADSVINAAELWAVEACSP